MSMKKIIVMLVGVGMALNSVVAAFTVSDISARQRYPWNGLVDLKFTVTGAIGMKYDTSFAAKDMVGNTNVTMKTIRKADGTTAAEKESLSPGVYNWVWNAAADLPDNWQSESVTVSVKVSAPKELLYMVIDLSAGANAMSYPVSYLDEVPEGGWSDEHKTTKMVLRKIQAGSFTTGYADSTSNPLRQITLTKPFYIGVFEVTRQQYELVMGSDSLDPYYQSSYGVMTPARTSWNAIRGDSSIHNWPIVKTIDSNSFVGRVGARTGLEIDLPTSAQWEYACRAGTTTEFYWGDVTVNGHDYAWYLCGWEYQPVGKLLPNNWGLYDMSGNSAEWCLDWGPWTGGSGYYYLLRGEDPEGPERPVGNAGRVVRGGDIGVDDVALVASDRDIEKTPPDSNFGGFRIVRAMTE